MSEEKKSEILEEKLDTEELDAVSGGFKSQGRGGCSANYYDRTCTATVEKGSWCHRNDWCEMLSEGYRETNKRKQHYIK